MFFPVPDAVELVAMVEGPGLVSPSEDIVDAVEPSSVVEEFGAEETSVLVGLMEEIRPMALSAGLISGERPAAAVNELIAEEASVPVASIEEAPSIAVSADSSGEGRPSESGVVTGASLGKVV